MRVVFLGRNRVAWRLVLLYLVTLGIYRRVWLYKVNKELDGHQALALNHRRIVTGLWMPLAALVLAVVVAQTGLHWALYGVAGLFLMPTAVITFQTARRTHRMLDGSGLRYGPPTLLGLTWLLPILGTLFFIPWQQSRLNRFWALERARPGHGIEIDIDLTKDPAFLIELGQAMRESYFAGSRFDRRDKARQARREARKESWAQVRAERTAVRAEGGSTPVLFWRRPTRPAPRLLHVTCGRCESRFDVTQDPTHDTPILCPKCGLAEVVAGLHSNPLAKREVAAVPQVSARCPKCKTQFHAVRNLHGPTELRCPTCGRAETIPAPGVAAPAGKSRRNAA